MRGRRLPRADASPQGLRPDFLFTKAYRFYESMFFFFNKSHSKT